MSLHTDLAILLKTVTVVVREPASEAMSPEAGTGFGIKTMRKLKNLKRTERI